MASGRLRRDDMQKICVNGSSYPVYEKPGYLKVDLGGILGWTAVWVSLAVELPYEMLVRRVKLALTGRQ